jgi:hypothetical protein
MSSLGDLHPKDTRPVTEILAALRRTSSALASIFNGTIRSREFIAWTGGNTPTRVAYMDTNIQGFATNEVIIDIGDDSDIDVPTARDALSCVVRARTRLTQRRPFKQPRSAPALPARQN